MRDGAPLGLAVISRAKQQRMNVSSPLTAWLTDAVAVPSGAALAAHFTHLGSVFLP